MGLDMYFYKKNYVKNWDHYPDKVFDYNIKLNKKPIKHIDKKKITYVVETFATWRKFNALHDWFVDVCGDGEDDCKEIMVSQEEIVTILGILKEVKKHPEKAKDLLPTASGFFFDGTDYDEYYFENVDNSIKIFENALKILEADKKSKEYIVEFTYQASW